MRRGQHERVNQGTSGWYAFFIGASALFAIALLAAVGWLIFNNTMTERQIEVNTEVHNKVEVLTEAETEASAGFETCSRKVVSTTSARSPTTTVAETTTTQDVATTTEPTATTTHSTMPATVQEENCNKKKSTTTTTTRPDKTTTTVQPTTTTHPSTTTTYPTTTVHSTTSTTTTHPTTTTTHPPSPTTTTTAVPGFTPNIGVRQPITPDVAHPGDIIEYRLIITNFGRGEAVNVVVSEELPEGLVYTDTGSRVRQWSFGNIPPNGGEAEEAYHVKVSDNAHTGGYDNLVTIKADNHNEFTVANSLNIVSP